MASPRLDRRTPGTSDWGKPQVSYPYGSVDFPKIVETKTQRRDGAVPAFASPHPDRQNYPNAILLNIRSEAGDNSDYNLWLTYDTIPGPILTSFDQDSETLALVTITRQRVLAGGVTAGAGTPGTVTTYEAIDSLIDLKTTRTITTSLPGRDEYRSGEYAFPTRLHSIAGSAAVATNGTTILMLNPVQTTGRRLFVMNRVAISYATSAPDLNTAITIYNFPVQDLIFNGPFFNIDYPRVLNDAISLDYTAGSDNVLWPGFEEKYNADASSVSATEYNALIGTEILIGGQSSKWNYGMFRQEEIYTKVRA